MGTLICKELQQAMSLCATQLRIPFMLGFFVMTEEEKKGRTGQQERELNPLRGKSA